MTTEGVQAAHGVTLANGPGGPDGPNGQDWGARLRPDGLRRGKPCETPWVCVVAVWFGAVKIFRRVMLCLMSAEVNHTLNKITRFF